MKILIVCESTYLYESGGRVVRYLSEILKNKHQLKIIVLSPKRDDFSLGNFYQNIDIEFMPLKKNVKSRFLNLFFVTNELKVFRKSLRDYLPDVVHFASFDHTKPAQFIEDAKNFGARVILQPWTMHFFCMQGFGFRKGKQCTLCATGNYSNAILKKCTTVKGVPSLIEKKVLHKKALKADGFLSSNSDLDIILNQYGIENKYIYRFPIPFDYNFLNNTKTSENEYFIFYGQANEHKGLDVLLNIFKKLKKQKLQIHPIQHLPEDKFKNTNIEVINNSSWSSGLKEAIANAKVVILPSLWATSTEYAMCEALLMKKPIIIFNVGVHKDIFRHKENAMVIEPNDLKGLENAILELDINENLRRKIGENGYNTLLKINNPKKLLKELNGAYTLKK